MSELKATPGPYRVAAYPPDSSFAPHVPVRENNGSFIIAYGDPRSDNSGRIGTTDYTGEARRDRHREDDPIGLANAHLFAASWGMYRALKRITDCYGVGSSPEQFCENVREFMEEGRAELAKARGE